ncbi:Peptidase A1 [Corchorus olitorius]|uniref:Peptidase A1 n=1 Tax=Corchorus olitorius TaxID=93759 RepID=A0A1R3I7M6_9ROSI|nr:Peptidase A1 [Corchorus olitorius]
MVMVSDYSLVQLANTSHVPRLVFGCVYHIGNKSPYYSPPQGILGLGKRKGSIISSQLSAILYPPPPQGVLGLGKRKESIPSQLSALNLTQNVIGHCLKRQGGGFLLLGADNIPENGMTWTPMLFNSNGRHYGAGPVKLLFGGNPTGIEHLIVIFDTAYILTLTCILKFMILYLIRNNVRRSQLQDVKNEGLSVCWRDTKPIKAVQDVRNYFSTLSLSFPGDVQLQLPPEAYLIATEQGNICLGIKPDMYGNRPEQETNNVIGAISMQDKLMVFDNEKQRIGWACADCTLKNDTNSHLWHLIDKKVVNANFHPGRIRPHTLRSSVQSMTWHPHIAHHSLYYLAYDHSLECRRLGVLHLAGLSPKGPIPIDAEQRKITRIQISSEGDGDRLVWPHNREESYTVESGYQRIKQSACRQGRSGPSSSHTIPDKLWKLVWNLKVPNRVRIFLWRACKNILATNHTLWKRHIRADPLCSCCSEFPETIEHVLLLFLNDSRLNKEQHTHLSTVIAVTCWIIWKARCQHNFENAELLSERTVPRIQRFILEIEDANTLTRCKKSSVEIRIKEKKWHAPEEGWTKLNCDGTMDVESSDVGVGVVVRDTAGKMIGGRGRSLQINSIEELKPWQ